MLMEFYRSTDAQITTADTEAGLSGVGRLGRGWVHTALVGLRAPSTPGPYYYGACVWARGESDYSNNCSTSVRLDVVARPQGTPDLVIPTMWHGIGPTQELSFYVDLRNDGDAASPAATVTIYLSADSTISTADQSGGSVSVEAVNPGATVTNILISMRLPHRPGYYYYGACVNAVAGESDTTNNCWPSSVEIRVW